ncbi:hypothetical protein N2152v2_008683 [Parachlorella kessleri]
MEPLSLFANFGDPTATPLHWAALRGNLDQVQALLAAEPGSVANTDNYGWTSLHWAAAAGQARCIPLLLRAGASLETRGCESHTPWVVKLAKVFYFDSPAIQTEANALAAAGFVEKAQTLRELLALPDAKATAGATPLHVAAGMGAVDCIRCPVQPGAQLEATNSLGHTALHLAAICIHVPALRALLQAGADVRAGDGHNNTPVHLAAGGGAAACMRWLLAAGADMQAAGFGRKRAAGMHILANPCGYNAVADREPRRLQTAGMAMVPAGCSNFTSRFSRVEGLVINIIASWFKKPGSDTDWPPSLSTSAVEVCCIYWIA